MKSWEWPKDEAIYYNVMYMYARPGGTGYTGRVLGIGR